MSDKYLNKSEGLECWKTTISEVLEKNNIVAKISWDMCSVGADMTRFLATLTVGKYTGTAVVEFIPDTFSVYFWKDAWQASVEKALDGIARQALQGYSNENKPRTNT